MGAGLGVVGAEFGVGVETGGRARWECFLPAKIALPVHLYVYVGIMMVPDFGNAPI